METLEHDIRGQICPSTLLVALRELNTHQEAIRAGRLRLRFVTDNRDCVATIPESAGNMGYVADVTDAGGGCYVIEVRRA